MSTVAVVVVDHPVARGAAGTNYYGSCCGWQLLLFVVVLRCVPDCRAGRNRRRAPPRPNCRHRLLAVLLFLLGVPVLLLLGAVAFVVAGPVARPLGETRVDLGRVFFFDDDHRVAV